MLTILGHNDRSLSLALVGKKKGLDVSIIGKYKKTKSLPDEMLRQSINWDLVTGLKRPDFDSWRMDYFLSDNRNYNSQADIEEPPFISKDKWKEYIDTCTSMLKASGVEFIEDEIDHYSKNYVRFKDGSIRRHQNLCIALEPRIRSQPLYIKQDHFDRIVPMIWTHTKPFKVLVLPTGNEEYSMNASMYLKEMGHDVTYLFYRREDIKHSDYPVPAFNEWGEKSSLGSYYRNFIREESYKASYLRKIEAFTPSVLRETLRKFLVSGCKLIHYESLSGLNHLKWTIELEDFDYYVDLRSGLPLSIEGLPPNDCTLPLREKPNYPLLMDGMRSPNGVYYTGALAEYFDGPRQNYILSAGLTSLEIVEDIIARR